MNTWPYEQRPVMRHRWRTFGRALVYIGMLGLSATAWWILVMGIIGLIH